MGDRIDLKKVIEETDDFGEILTAMIVLLVLNSPKIEERKEKAYEE